MKYDLSKPLTRGVRRTLDALGSMKSDARSSLR